MRRLDFWILSLLFIGGVVSIFLDDIKPLPHIIGQKELLHQINLEGRYISTDEVAKMIMEKDPSLLLVDVRSPEEYNKYTLEGAMNIPYDKIMDKEYEAYLNQDVYTTVLFSNGSSLADQAWLTLTSYGYEGNKVMKGGLNEWYRTILHPQKPEGTILDREAEKRYLFRKGAQIYFTGAQITTESAPKPKAQPVKPVIKRKKKEVTGGCG